MNLWEAFSELSDPRTGPAQRNDLREMIVMALGAVLCGCNTWVKVANWVEDHKRWLGKHLELKHGTPSHDTFGRVFSLLDGAVFERCFRQWISGVVGAAAAVVAIDGKTLCGSRDSGDTALHMVSAFAIDSGMCLRQESAQGWESRLKTVNHWLCEQEIVESQNPERPKSAPKSAKASGRSLGRFTGL